MVSMTYIFILIFFYQIKNPIQKKRYVFLFNGVYIISFLAKKKKTSSLLYLNKKIFKDFSAT